MTKSKLKTNKKQTKRTNKIIKDGPVLLFSKKNQLFGLIKRKILKIFLNLLYFFENSAKHNKYKTRSWMLTTSCV